MNTPLITDEKDLKWVLLGKILGTVSSRRVKQEMAKQGISPVNLAGAILIFVQMVMVLCIIAVLESTANNAEIRNQNRCA